MTTKLKTLNGYTEHGIWSNSEGRFIEDGIWTALYGDDLIDRYAGDGYHRADLSIQKFCDEHRDAGRRADRCDLCQATPIIAGREPLAPPVRAAARPRQEKMADSYRVAGTTDEVTECGVCGRQDLTRTVVLTAPDGTAVYAGTDCASRLAGRPVTLTEARRIDRSGRESQRAALAEQRSQENEAERAAVQRFVQDHSEHAGESYYRQMVAWRSAQDRAGTSQAQPQPRDPSKS